MAKLLTLLILYIIAFPLQTQAAPGTDRTSPMGDRTGLFDKGLYENADKTVRFVYYLLPPKNIRQGSKYPLIVVLHGRSGHAYGAYALAQKVLQEDMPAFVLVPVMSEETTDWTAEQFVAADPKNPKPIDHVAALTRDIAVQLPVDASRIYVTGYSMGGVGTFGALYYYPDIFAAGIPICGAWYPQDAKNFVKKPIWAFHGSADSLVPVRQTRDMIKAIRKKGGKPEYTEYPGVDHNSWINAYAEPDLWVWLFSHSKP